MGRYRKSKTRGISSNKQINAIRRERPVERLAAVVFNRAELRTIFIGSVGGGLEVFVYVSGRARMVR